MVFIMSDSWQLIPIRSIAKKLGLKLVICCYRNPDIKFAEVCSSSLNPFQDKKVSSNKLF
jgi:hypothetical protein